MITIPPNWSDEKSIRKVFSWLTRIGAAPKFGSRPIGWYQQHQCKAIEIIQKRCTDALLPPPVEVKAESRRPRIGGVEFTRPSPLIFARRKREGGAWKPIIGVNDLYAEADREARK